MTSQNLRNLARIGALRDAPVSRDDIASLIASSERMLMDAGNERNSFETRFKCAYDAVLKVAIAMLRKHGFRPATSAGHHHVAIQSLVHTLGWSAAEVRTLDAFRQLRHQEQYESQDVISAGQVEEIRRAAEKLLAQARKQLK